MVLPQMLLLFVIPSLKPQLWQPGHACRKPELVFWLQMRFVQKIMGINGRNLAWVFQQTGAIIHVRDTRLMLGGCLQIEVTSPTAEQTRNALNALGTAGSLQIGARVKPTAPFADETNLYTLFPPAGKPSIWSIVLST